MPLLMILQNVIKIGHVLAAEFQVTILLSKPNGTLEDVSNCSQL